MVIQKKNTDAFQTLDTLSSNVFILTFVLESLLAKCQKLNKFYICSEIHHKISPQTHCSR